MAIDGFREAKGTHRSELGTASAQWAVVASIPSPRSRPPMNVLFFALKRAYHGTLRVTRRVLARLGLTAARFDLLYILQKAGGVMVQRELRQDLGVAAPTVSRMLASLEELGLVERQVMEEDRRHRDVRLTKMGRRRVLRAARLLIHTGHVQLAVDSALCPQQWPSALAGELASGALEGTLRLLRHAYRDVATLHYPWTYDEDWYDFTQLRFEPERGIL
jgi:DNA-binding MarR family transcriptional regulator